MAQYPTHRFRTPKDDLGVPQDENHLLIEWFKGDARVVFSFTKKEVVNGNFALDCHFAANKKALRLIKESISDFTAMVQTEIPCCRMLLANIKKPSVKRLVNKCGFVYLGDIENNHYYVRKLWAE